MLDHPTLDQLKALRLDAPQVRVPRNGMAEAFTELQARGRRAMSRQWFERHWRAET